MSGINEQAEYEDTPEGWHNYWQKEMERAEANLKDFRRRGDRTVEKFLDKRSEDGTTRLNVFHSNIRTLRSFLFGNSPKTDVSRRNKDANDDLARVAAEILSRLINNDVEESGNDFTSVLQGALDDRLIPGLGVARVRYVYQTETKEVDPYNDPDTGETKTTQEQLISEEASIDYIHWRDMAWGYARTWKDLPWMAFRTFLTKDEARTRFGDIIAGTLEYKEVGPGEKGDGTFGEARDAWNKAEIWEICSKKHLKYFWWHKSSKVILDVKPDLLKLKGFWPTPKWMMANTTTTIMEPVPDYYFAQDLYQDIDLLMTRITILTDAVRAVGVYDEASGSAIGRMLDEGGENALIPVKDWQRFAEKGGLEGVVDWMPLESVVEAIDKLRQLLTDKMQLLYQMTGLSDIMRGQASEQRVSAAEQKLKARFGSIQIQALQDQFARFASELASLKAEVICKHFSAQTILEQSGIMATPDAQYAEQAVALLKQYDKADWRVAIKPETVAMTDYAQLQSERTEYLTALATFMQSAAPLYELSPAAAPVMLELLKWGLAGFKGSQQIEGVLDRAIDAVISQPPQPKGDEAKVAAEKEKTKQIQMKGQVEKEKMQGQRVLNKEKIQSERQKVEINRQNAQIEGQATALKAYAQIAVARAQAANPNGQMDTE